jgi:hypothetical protein
MKVAMQLMLKSIFLLLIWTIPILAQENGAVKKQAKITRDVGFGRDITSIGDINQDGINDLVVGKPVDFNQEVVVFFLDSTGKVKNETIITSNTNGFDTTLGDDDKFGGALTNLGDVNGDGIPDVAVGASGSDFSGPREGAVWLLFLNRDGTVKDYRKIDETSNDFNFSINQNESFGSPLGTLNDWDNNGVNELLVGSPFRKGDGGFWLLSLNKNGRIVHQQEFNSNQAPFNNFKLNSFGGSIDGIGDIDKNNVPDIAVGDQRHNPKGNNEQKGAFFTLLMEENNQNNLEVKNIQKITQNTGGFNDTLPRLSFLGSSITGLGDINGDTIPDLAVGSDGERYPKDSNANVPTGKIRIFFTKEDGTVQSYQTIGNNSGNFQDTLITDDRFGRGVSNLGDLDGDRVPELAIGAPGYGGNNKGSVFILFLNGVPQMPDDDDHDSTSGLEPQKPFKRLNTYPNPLAQSQNLTLSLPSGLPEGQRGKVLLFDMEGGAKEGFYVSG